MTAPHRSMARSSASKAGVGLRRALFPTVEQLVAVSRVDPADRMRDTTAVGAASLEQTLRRRLEREPHEAQLALAPRGRLIANAECAFARLPTNRGHVASTSLGDRTKRRVAADLKLVTAIDALLIGARLPAADGAGPDASARSAGSGNAARAGTTCARAAAARVRTAGSSAGAAGASRGSTSAAAPCRSSAGAAGASRSSAVPS
jgi:hypothetical protein